MKKNGDENKNSKSIKRPYNGVILFAVIYVLMTIISVVDRIFTLKKLSETSVTFGVIAKEFWFTFVVILLLILDAIIYRKKEIYGVILESAIGLSMILNIVISIFRVGFNIGALLLTLVLPMILIIHAMITLKNIKKQKSV